MSNIAFLSLDEAKFLGLPKITNTSVDLQKADLPENIFNGVITEKYQKQYTPKKFEDYLLNRPAVGANGTSVQVKVVKLFKYQLKCTGSSCDLYRSDYFSSTAEDKAKTMILKGCRKVILSRDVVVTSLFNIDIITDQAK